MTLLLGIHADNLSDLPPHSVLGEATLRDRYEAARDVGFRLIQGGDPALAAEAGLAFAGMGRVLTPADAHRIATAHPGGRVSLHVGTGFESEPEADDLLSAITEAGADHGTAMLVETHRATVTQDPWRTLGLLRRHPSLRLTGDFSHWYTGVEMVYGDWDAKLDALAPVFERVGLLHGRVGSPGSIQVDVTAPASAPFVAHFRELWSRVLDAARGEVVFVPELLSPVNHYAPQRDGVEVGDRWMQALALRDLAVELRPSR